MLIGCGLGTLIVRLMIYDYVVELPLGGPNEDDSDLYRGIGVVVSDNVVVIPPSGL